MKQFEGQSYRQWLDVKLCIQSDGYALIDLDGVGHYIGFPGEQGRVIAREINGMHTRVTQFKRKVEICVFTDDFDLAVELIEKRTKSELKQTDPLQLIAGFDQLLLSWGLPVQNGFAKLLLSKNKP